MSSRPALELQGVSKMYRLFASPALRLKEALHPLRKTYHEPFWALREVSLSLAAGRTLGVLGLNGSGKSTLLQIVAGVLAPTSGNVQVSGKVAALLELGAGFNPELSGRDNVVTNALILGLSEQEAEARLASVEDFADIGRHFNQPVKTYSSGMFMRVAFAMAMSVDPDLMIIDEALAVGDSKFQEKCFRRLKAFQESGRSVLFVTHDRASVTQLCDEAILLHQGQLVAHGDPKTVVDDYTELMVTGRLRAPSATRRTAPEQEEIDPTPSATIGPFDPTAEDRLSANPLYNTAEQRWGVGGARIVDALILGPGQEVNPASVPAGATVEVHIKVAYQEELASPLIGMTWTNLQGITLYGTHNGWLDASTAPASPGDVRAYRFRLRLPLAVGAWFLELAVARHQTEICDVRSRALHLDVLRDRMLIGLVDLGATFAEQKLEAGDKDDSEAARPRGAASTAA